MNLSRLSEQQRRELAQRLGELVLRGLELVDSAVAEASQDELHRPEWVSLTDAAVITQTPAHEVSGWVAAGWLQAHGPADRQVFRRAEVLAARTRALADLAAQSRGSKSAETIAASILAGRSK